jgi:hypothetical protein
MHSLRSPLDGLQMIHEQHLWGALSVGLKFHQLQERRDVLAHLWALCALAVILLGYVWGRPR